MSVNFHETVMGRRFFDAQFPKMVKALERIADAMEKADHNPVYLYRERTDSVICTSEHTRIFDTEEKAKECLKESVEAFYGRPFEEIPESECFTRGTDVYSDTYVSYLNKQTEETTLWTVTKMSVE